MFLICLSKSHISSSPTCNIVVNMLCPCIWLDLMTSHFTSGSLLHNYELIMKEVPSLLLSVLIGLSLSEMILCLHWRHLYFTALWLHYNHQVTLCCFFFFFQLTLRAASMKRVGNPEWLPVWAHIRVNNSNQLRERYPKIK